MTNDCGLFWPLKQVTPIFRATETDDFGIAGHLHGRLCFPFANRTGDVFLFRHYNREFCFFLAV